MNTQIIRRFQYAVIALLLFAGAGAYYHMQSRAGVTLKSSGTTKLNASQNALMTNGLIGLWSLDGADISGTTAYDRSGSGNDGTLTNSPAAAVGKIGQALNFSGSNDIVSVSAAETVMDNLSAMTLAAWIHTPTAGAGRILDKAGGIGPTSGWVLLVSGGQSITFEVDYANGTNTNLIRTTSSGSLVENTWQHVVLAWDGSSSALNAHIYINGVEARYQTTTDGNQDRASDAAEAFKIGAHSVSAGQFDGLIDDVRVYNRVFSATEAESLYKLGIGARQNAADSQQDRFQRGLAGYWKLDEGTGTGTTADASTNANTLTMTNMESGDWVAGRIPPFALDFDGADEYLTVADPSSGVLDFTDGADLTLTGWFNRDTFAADHTVIAKKNDQATNQGYIVWIDNNGATDILIFEASDGTDTYHVPSFAQFNATGWHHYAVTWNDTAGVTLFIDGHPDVGTPTGTFSSVNSLANALAFRIGAESDAGNPFDGRLDEQRVYNRALSADEIADLYRATQPKDADTSLKGYWSFNGSDMAGATAFDRSGAGNNGTLTGGPTLAIGKIGQSLEFDGVDDRVPTSVPAGTIFNNIPSLSICAWIRPLNEGEGGDGKIAAKRGTGGWSFEFGAGSPVNALGFIVIYSGNDLIKNASDNSLTLNIWQHVCMTWDGSDATAGVHLYVSGVETGYQTPTEPTLVRTDDSSNTFNIGNNNTSSSTFAGSIDDVRVYNRVLTADEIKQLYNIGR